MCGCLISGRTRVAMCSGPVFRVQDGHTLNIHHTHISDIYRCACLLHTFVMFVANSGLLLAWLPTWLVYHLLLCTSHDLRHPMLWLITRIPTIALAFGCSYSNNNKKRRYFENVERYRTNTLDSYTCGQMGAKCFWSSGRRNYWRAWVVGQVSLRSLTQWTEAHKLTGSPAPCGQYVLML